MEPQDGDLKRLEHDEEHEHGRDAIVIAAAAARPVRPRRSAALRRPPMSHNTFGHLFRVTTWGESHGPALGCVVDGCPARPAPVRGRRAAPGSTGGGRAAAASSPSGARRTRRASSPACSRGAPRAPDLHPDREHRRPLQDYGAIARSSARHADWSWRAKYGLRDPRGGGRSSARETAARVAAGAVARVVLGEGVRVRAAVVQVGALAVDRARFDWRRPSATRSGARTPGPSRSGRRCSTGCGAEGSSAGAVVEVEAKGVPAGWGAPRVRQARRRAGRGADEHQRGQGRGDRRRASPRRRAGRTRGRRRHAPRDRTARRCSCPTHAGGVAGGVSTGQPVVARLALKPTSSITTPRPSLDVDGAEVEVATLGRPRPLRGPPRRARGGGHGGVRAGGRPAAPPRPDGARRPRGFRRRRCG